MLNNTVICLINIHARENLKWQRVMKAMTTTKGKVYVVSAAYSNCISL